MTIHSIISIPDPRLRQVCLSIDTIDANLQLLIDEMFETMYAAPGVGLAAPQIGINRRLAVIDVTQDKSQQLVLINPVIIKKEGEEVFDEGCLSVPGGIYDKVERASWVKMQALNRDGKSYEIEAEGLLAQCIQHELDHLDGKLYIDKLSSLKRFRISQKVQKYKRELAKKK